ncbi:hypothetical protein SAMN02745131_04029 [Flavisolibacter ginsengisoli DSM 18119]|jgi:hypothetical protein|uniref:Uncharacterized protein n=1 Tax=Flavisolibacter ginsengisoli DSM 18119 TaxID=1121884 RepID=A0A1M5G2H6_9BACT|nr:hypothetical protein SAMN02745131_04029 [Flavisolibacter ginsengisoli DSM 18119]
MQVIDTCFLIPFSWRWFEWFDEGIRPYVTGMSKINSTAGQLVAGRVAYCGLTEPF